MEKLMIEKSNEFLYAFFKNLAKNEVDEIGLMGGWAVHYTLKKKLERFKIDGTIAASATMLKIGQDKLTDLLEKI